MRDTEDLDDAVRAALARADDLQDCVLPKLEALIAKAEEHDERGRLTSGAKRARQILTNPVLNSTVPSVALSRTINPALDKALDDLQKSEIEYRTALATVRILSARREMFLEAKGTPRKRTPEVGQPEPEEWYFLRAMRERDVPISALDQLNVPELDFIATLFDEKTRDYRHRDRGGSWWALVRAGALGLASEAYSDDERDAIVAATAEYAEEERQAYKALCEIAGRDLDIPANFAFFVMEYARLSSTERPIGNFERTVAGMGRARKQADAEKILTGLGLSLAEVTRALSLLQTPDVSNYVWSIERIFDIAATNQREHLARVKLYIPAAERALKERHENERRTERELLQADDLGYFDMEAALRRLGEYDDPPTYEHATVRRQIREGKFRSLREEERQATIQELASILAVSEETRTVVSNMGIPLPQVVQIPPGQDVIIPNEATSAVAEDLQSPEVDGTTHKSTSTSLKETDFGSIAEHYRDHFILPADLDKQYAQAYEEYARNMIQGNFFLTGEMWYEHFRFDLSYGAPDLVADAVLANLRRAIRNDAVDDLHHAYLSTLLSLGLDEAERQLNQYLIARYTYDIATSMRWDDERKLIRQRLNAEAICPQQP